MVESNEWFKRLNNITSMLRASLEIAAILISRVIVHVQSLIRYDNPILVSGAKP